MMTNKKIVVRHLHKYTKKKIFFLTQSRNPQKVIITVKDCFFLIFLPFFFSHDEMMRSIIHKYKALQKNIDTKLIWGLNDFFSRFFKKFSFSLLSTVEFGKSHKNHQKLNFIAFWFDLLDTISLNEFPWPK